MKKEQIRYIFITRMATGNVPSTNLVSVICEENIIKRVSFSQQIKDDKDYLKAKKEGRLLLLITNIGFIHAKKSSA